MKRGRVASILLLIAGLGFALLGQFYFAYRREYERDGIFLWCAALLSFGLLMRRMARLEHGRSGQRRLSLMSGRSSRALAVIGGVWLTMLAGALARLWPDTADFSSLLWLWLIGVACFILAFVPSFSLRNLAKVRYRELSRQERQPVTFARFRRRRVGLAGLVVLVLVAAGLRIFDLEHIPVNLGGDEGTWGMEGLAMFDGRLANPFATRWLAFPSLSFLAWGLSTRFFGQTVAGLRAPSALIGTATVLTTFLLARELWGRRVAWLGAVALAFGHFHIHYSRLAVNNVADGLLVTLALWLLVRGLRSGREVLFALSGTVIGLGWYGYFGARLIGVVVIFYLAWRVGAEHRFLARYGRLLLILLGAALVVVAPLLLHYLDHPDMLAARSRQVSIFASGWLAREREITGSSTGSLMLQQLWKSVSAFNYTLDPTFWYRPAIPLLDFVSGVLFVLGLLWTMAHYRWPANGMLLIWFWLALFLGWVVTENPPSSMRLVIVAPALALLVGLGLNWLMELIRRVFSLGGEDPGRHSAEEGRGRVSVASLAAIFLLFGIAVLNVRHYFVVYTPTRVYGNPTAEIATDLGRYLAQQGDDYVVYFYAPPFMYWDFGTLRFLTRGVEGMDVPPPGEGEFPVSDWNRGARFVFLPERLDELEDVHARHPGGVERPARSGVDGRLLYVLYEVGPR